jgi:general secretion pathway protein M
MRRILALALVALLAAAFWRAVAEPLWRTWRNNAQTVSDRRDAVARLRGLAASRAVYESALREADEDFDVSEALMESPSETLAAADLQQQVKDLVEASGGTLVSVQPTDPRPAGPFVRIGLSVRLITSTGALQQVLYKLESSLPVVVIDEMLLLARTATRGARQGQAPGDELDVRLQLAGFVSGAAAPGRP